jgi:mRNA-degrading endonuclease RelE of RelBE toxin-antitoxin system
MKVRFLYPAFLEYNSAIDFYNTQQTGLGKKFIKEIDKYLEIIKKYPQSFPIYTSKATKTALSIFPYNIIYSIEEDEILIYAVAHQHRSPEYWLSR